MQPQGRCWEGVAVLCLSQLSQSFCPPATVPFTEKVGEIRVTPVTQLFNQFVWPAWRCSWARSGVLLPPLDPKPCDLWEINNSNPQCFESVLQIVTHWPSICCELQKAASVCAALMTSNVTKRFHLWCYPFSVSRVLLAPGTMSCKITKKSYGNRVRAQVSRATGLVTCMFTHVACNGGKECGIHI